MEKEYWLFTLLTGDAQYVNCYFAWFPSKRDLQIACSKMGNSTTYAIINVNYPQTKDLWALDVE